MALSIANMKSKLRGLSLPELAALILAAIGIVLLAFYLIGGFNVWRQARHWEREFKAQQKIADEERAKREAAERTAEEFKQAAAEARVEAAKQEAISNELRNEIKPAIEELGRRREATAASSQRYDQVRRAPRVVRPDDTPDRIGARLNSGADEFRSGNN